MNVYKVITKDRYSCIMPKESPYCLRYVKGRIVEGIKGTYGVMCFETKENTKTFIDLQHFVRRGKMMVIKVSLIGEISYPEVVAKWLYKSDIETFYKKMQIDYPSWNMIRPPMGTICCDKVKVLT